MRALQHSLYSMSRSGHLICALIDSLSNERCCEHHLLSPALSIRHQGRAHAHACTDKRSCDLKRSHYCLSDRGDNADDIPVWGPSDVCRALSRRSLLANASALKAVCSCGLVSALVALNTVKLCGALRLRNGMLINVWQSVPRDNPQQTSGPTAREQSVVQSGQAGATCIRRTLYSLLWSVMQQFSVALLTPSASDSVNNDILVMIAHETRCAGKMMICLPKT